MQQVNKIQCPNCGATSSFKEIKPGLYACGYCLSQWEQVSILPNTSVTADQSMYQMAQKVYAEQKALTVDRQKYFERAYTAIVQLDVFSGQIANALLRKDIFGKTQELINIQKQEYAKKGITENTNYYKLLTTDAENMVFLFYLAEMEHAYARSIYLDTQNSGELKKALNHLNIAEKIRGTSIDNFNKDLAVSKVGVLKRLYGDERVYKYLHELLNRFSETAFKKMFFEQYKYEPNADDLESHKHDENEYREEVTYLFEPIFFSEEYLTWEKKNRS